MSVTTASAAPKPKIWNDPFWRGLIVQGALLVVVLFLFAGAVINARNNMQARGIPTDFAFWDRPASFDINQTLIPYSATSPNSQVFWVGLLNTLLVAGLGIVLSTVIGFAVGAARLSTSWLVAKLAAIYVEGIRNVPLLLQIIFWYNVVLGNLPHPRQAAPFLDIAFLSNRGLFVPAPVFGPGSNAIWIALAIGIVGAVLFRIWAAKRQRETGQQAPVGLITTAFVLGLPLVAYLAAGRPIGVDYPHLKGFNFTGGQRLTPEFVALLLALTLYTAAFIAEIVRSGILAVPKGQSEAAAALGLRATPTRKLVIMPQAMRVIIPPTGNQFIAMLKDSSLVSVVGVWELMYLARTLGQTEFRHFEMLITASMIYWALSIGLELLQSRIEKRFGKSNVR